MNWYWCRLYGPYGGGGTVTITAKTILDLNFGEPLNNPISDLYLKYHTLRKMGL